MYLNKKNLVYFISTVLLLAFLLLSFFAYYLFSPIKLHNNYLLDIPSGQPATMVGSSLQANHIIASPKLFKVALIVLNKANKVQSGEYEITNGMNIWTIIKKISTGDVKKYSFRINEAETVSSVINRLKNEVKLKNTSLSFIQEQPQIFIKTMADLRVNQKPEQSKLLDLDKIPNLDGLFYPDTYYYSSKQSDIDLLAQAYNKLINVLTNLWQESINLYPRDSDYLKVVSTPYQALILASIVERESANNNERKVIAGVIYNRLLRNMPLQVDPTVIYSLGEKYKGNLSKEDLSNNNPYNTYINRSLPPGPIGAVSIGSLRAAINPDKNDFLYFVSKGDGTHYFSRTLEEHNAAVKQYQKKV